MDTSPTALAWGAEIKRRREELQLTRQHVADRVKVSRAMVGYWETGKHAPSAEAQARLVRELDLDVAAIYDAMHDDAAEVPS